MPFASRILGAEPGEIVVRPVDLVYAHDATAPLAIKAFREMGFDRVFDPSKVLFFFDHVYPAPTPKAAELHREVREFAAEQGIRVVEGQGISHQLLAESDVVRPGQVVVGGDSHTVTLGARGVLAMGMGSTDIAVAMGLGETWLTVPESLRIELRGRFAPAVVAKDLALAVCGTLGVEGGNFKSVEYVGEAHRLNLADRLTLCNLGAEVGAKNAVVTDEPGPGAEFTFDLSALEPQLAVHPRVDTVKPVSDVEGLEVDQVYLGTCTNGRIEDMRQFDAILAGRPVATRTLCTPASATVMRQMADEGILSRFVAAGVTIQSPGCGACLGRHHGVLGDGEVCVATGSRNFVGRMGSPKAEIYLSSPYTAAAAAVTGKVTDPRRLLARPKEVPA
ncbi:MAG: 3-isopropylmalate dehydratase/homoaconitate hydratase family large subunit [Methanobacteriota archaeon]